MRVAVAAALLAAALAGALTAGEPASVAAATAERESRAAVAFLPGPAPRAKPSAIERLERFDQLDLGFMSAVMGSYVPEQTLLDISSGSRTWTSLYDRELETTMYLQPEDEGDWSLRGWSEARTRAATAPADVVPGLLAQAAGDAGFDVGYAGLRERSNREAIVAADRSGRIGQAVLSSRRQAGRTAAALWRRTPFLVARLPSGRDGREALATLLRERGAGDLLLVVQQPAGIRRRLLAAGAAGLEGDGALTSASTRTEGLIVSTDVAPTLLEHFGVPVPDDVSGEPIEVGGERTVAELEALRGRLAEIGPRRWKTILAGLIGAVVLAGAFSAVRPGRGRLRLVARAAFLAALWLPSVLLVTGALAPSRLGEALLIAACSALLALSTDALLPWRRAIAVAAGVTVGAHVADLALDLDLIARSLLGPNPILGARFYGVGNELEVTLAVIGLLGLGAALANAPPRPLTWGLASGGAVLAFALSWGRLGADVGASLMLAAGTAAAAVAALGERPGRRGIAIVLLAPVAALGALVALDLVTGGDAHLTRSVLRAGSLGDLADVAQRRVELSYNSLGRGIIWLLVAIATAAIVVGVRARRRLLAPLEGSPGLRAAMWGALVAVVVGALSNDSGPIILLIGTSYLALAAGYFQALANSD